jgi:hypothetical protein
MATPKRERRIQLDPPAPEGETVTIVEWAREKKDLYVKHAPEFQQIFGVRLKPYYDLLTGFDIIKFDELIKPGEDDSLEQAVRERFGDRAVELVKALF